ncbi:PGF-CTERM sorting domain-containing protein [Halobacteriales archaeon Cl-PHB]
MSARRRQRIGTLAMVLLLVASAAMAGIGAANHEESSGMDTADEVYVNDDGDVVAVYEETDETDTDSQAQYGVDVASGLAYALVTDPVEGSTDATGNLSAVATPDSMSVDGMLSVATPDSIESFSLSASSQTTRQTATGDLSIAATTSGGSSLTRLLESASTTGEVTMGGTSLTATGSVQASAVVPLGQETSMDVSITEGNNGYTLSIAQHQAINEFQVRQWETREQAKQTIQRQYAMLGQSLGGDATVTLETYSLSQNTNGRYVLDVAYTVEYTGIDRGLEQMLPAVLAQNPDISSQQATNFAKSVTDLQVNEMSFDYAVQGSQFEANFALDLGNYNDFLVEYMAIASATSADSSFQDQLDRLEKQFEARKAANMAQTYTWSGSLSHPSQDATKYEFDASYRTQNWAAYTDELAARDLPVFNSSTELSGSLQDGQLVLSGSLSTSGENLFKTIFEQQMGSATMQADTTEAFQSFAEAQPRKAKLELSLDDEQVRMEMGAKFGNLAALRDAVTNESSTPAYSEVVGRTDNGSTKTYVKVDGAVSGDAAESDVRSLSYVDSETEVHLAGDWDQDFPTTDKQQARSFLGIQGDGSDGSTPGGLGPGFGVTTAIVALLGAALLVRLRD